MKKNWLIILIVAGIISGGSALIFCDKIKTQKIESKSEAKIHSAYSQIVELYGNLNVEPQSGPDQKIGGISSHHFFVTNKIASFMAGLKSIDPATIVILGPNHFGAGSQDILISGYDYETPWGTLENDKNIGSRLINSGSAFNEEEPFEREHSISTLVGFIKYYLPQTKIVPIIFKLNTPQVKADKLADELIKNLDDDSFVLASVDFSHHVNRQTAIDQDKESIKAIENFDLEKIYSLKLDSPASIYVLLKYLEAKDAKQIEYKNTNAADLLGNPDYKDVTSYVFAYFN